jgi:glycosyltransferase involved in cell wall biosynthesis
MYPKMLYPWWDPKQEQVDAPKFSNCEHLPILSRRNPISRIQAWYTIKGDVLHMQYWIWFLAPIYITIWIIAKYIKKIPIIITIHNVQAHEKAIRKTRIDKLVYSVASSYIVHSQDNKEQLLSIVGTNKTIQVFPHGIISPKVEPIPKNIARDTLNIPTTTKVLLFFWIIRAYKGLDTLLQAYAQLIKHDQNYVLIIAWKCREDRNIYQHIIDDLDVWTYIIRVDWFLDDDAVNTVFCASDMLVLPYTHFDAQSWVVALGLWYEIPMIVSNLWWLTEVIWDERYIWDGTSSQSLAQKIQSCNQDQAHHYILERKKHFDRDEIVQEYLLFASNVSCVLE